jgi:hypothetical protein
MNILASTAILQLRIHGCKKVDGQSNRVGATVPGRPRVAVYQTSKLQIIDSGEATEGLPYTILPHFVTVLTAHFDRVQCLTVPDAAK